MSKLIPTEKLTDKLREFEAHAIEGIQLLPDGSKSIEVDTLRFERVGENEFKFSWLFKGEELLKSDCYFLQEGDTLSLAGMKFNVKLDF